MAAQYPTSASGDSNLYVAVNQKSTPLTDNPLTAGATTVNVVDASSFPSVGAITIDAEIIKYTGKTGTSLTGCTRGFDGTSGVQHSVNAPVYHRIIADHHNVLKEEIKAIETDLVACKAALNDVDTPASTSADVKDRLDQIVSQIKLITGETNWYSAPDSSISSLVSSIGDKLPLSGGTLTGNLVIPVGAAGTPSIYFTGDPDTGPYQGAANSNFYGIAVGGVSKITIEPAWINLLTTVIVPNGSVSSPGIVFADNNNGLYYIGSDKWGLSAGGVKAVDLSPNGTATLGTNTNNSAPAGYTGEHVSSAVGTLTNFPATGEYGDLVSISLTAGDWDVSLIGEINRNGATFGGCVFGISTTSGNSSTGLTIGISRGYFNFTGISFTYHIVSLPVVRVSLASTTTVYLKYYADYSVATPQMRGGISARRPR